MKLTTVHTEKEYILFSIEHKNRYSKIFFKDLKIFTWSAAIWFSRVLKRCIDIVSSVISLIILSPLLSTVAIAIKLESKGPIIFKQIRVGQNGKHFQFYKFRSMRTLAESEKAQLLAQNESKDGVIFKMKNDPRITRVGKFIRKYSIDELPQLINVLEGNMSLVGPRPPLPAEVQQYTLEDRKRLHIKPGLTCIWQISGRSDIPFKQQVNLDKEYIRNHNFFVDIWILIKTVYVVVTGKGAY